MARRIPVTQMVQVAASAHGVTCSMARSVALCLSLCAAPAVTSTQALTAPELLSATGIRHGLCALVGMADGNLAAELAQGGKLVVHGLAPDAASLADARRRILDKKIYGSASFETPVKWDRLPYADNLVNLLVIDLDALGNRAPAAQEILRAVAPRGVVYQKKGGAWSKTVKPVPKETDEWTHWDYDHTRHALSKDQVVAPSTSMQWIQGPYLGVSRGHGNPLAGYRLSDGIAYHTTRQIPKGDWFLTARDAYSGIHLWRTRIDAEAAEKIASGGKIYTYLKKNEPMVSLDGRTGEVVTRFTAGAVLDPTRLSHPTFSFASLIVNGMLMQGGPDAFRALDAQTGSLKWKLERQGKLMLFPVASGDGKRLYLPVADAQKTKGYWRFPYAFIDEILCLDAQTGKVLWTNKDFSGQILTQMVWSQGRLAYLAPNSGFKNRDFSGAPSYMGVLDAGTGAVIWKKTYDHWGNNVLVRGDTLFNLAYKGFYAYSMKDGSKLTEWKADANGNCAWSRGTENFLIFSSVSYVDWRNLKFLRQFITRSTCATGGFPGNGMTYHTPNSCGCYAMVRGHMALSSQPVLPPWLESERLQTHADAAFTGAVEPAAAALPVGQDFTHHDVYGSATSDTAMAGALRLFARIQEHRLEARKSDGSLAWTFVAGGRISKAPVVTGGLAVFGSHDGWVYALDAKTGKQQWRFLAAPRERKMVAQGQLESAWPVYNVLLMDGMLFASAGRHPELDGGIYVYGLGADGKVKWKTLVRKTQPWREPSFRWAPKWWPDEESNVANAALTGESGKLRLPGGKDLGKTGLLIDHGVEAECYLDKDCKQPPTEVTARKAAGSPLELGLGHFTLERSGPVHLSIIGLDGKQVRTLFDGQAPAGRTEFSTDWKLLGSGYYLLLLRSGSEVRVRPVERMNSVPEMY